MRNATVRITEDAIEICMLPGASSAPVTVITSIPDVSTAPAANAARFEARNDGQSQYDRTTGLEWTAATIAKDVNFDEATKRAGAVTVGGHTDWRLPTVQELLTLVDYSKHEPAIDTDAFPDTKSRWYWSSSPAAWSPADCAWLVSFSYGLAGYGRRSSLYCVRAVRSAAAPGQ